MFADRCYLGKTLLILALLHFVIQGQICLLLQVSLDCKNILFGKIEKKKKKQIKEVTQVGKSHMLGKPLFQASHLDQRILVFVKVSLRVFQNFGTIILSHAT